MFRMPPLVDPAEEQKRVSADVRNNFVIFAVLCTAIRLGKNHSSFYTFYKQKTNVSI